MNKRVFCATSIIVITLVSLSNVLAHGGATGVVKERMDSMKEMKNAMKDLSSMFKGEINYDSKLVKEASVVLQSKSGDNLTRLFPNNSLHKPSEAKPEIWTKWEKFRSLSDQLSLYSSALENASENDASAELPSASDMMGGVQPMMEISEMAAEEVFKLVADTCSSCHTQYRVDKE